MTDIYIPMHLTLQDIKTSSNEYNKTFWSTERARYKGHLISLKQLYLISERLYFVKFKALPFF